MLTPQLDAVVRRAVQGSDDAYRFLFGWHHLCHAIDDIIDGDVPAERIKEELLATFVYAKDLYSTAFYRQFTAELSGMIDAIFNAYADSVKWENNAQVELWKQEQADILRSQGCDMILLVAKLCGGYDHMRSLSEAVRELSQRDQRTG